ncbi:MAG: SGNH/GDSL hydrolase family protein [Thermodesulfobacteriota bacterium]
MKKWLPPAFLLAVLLLVLGEVGARLFFAKSVSGRFEYGYSANAGFDERADGTVKLIRAGGRRFHPQTFFRRRPAGTFRIFVIGDSVPRGPSFKGGYPWLLGQELRARHIQAESVNMALPGYGARRCQIVLRKALEFEPSLIILHVNDSNKYEDEREYRRSQEFKTWHPCNWPMKMFIFRRLYEAKMEKLFWRLVPEQVRLKFAANDPDAQVAASEDANEVQARIKVARETNAASVALARTHQIPLLLVTQCRLLTDGNGSFHFEDHGLDDLGRSLTGEGVYHLSMKEVFSPLPNARSYFSDSGHLNRSGHLLLAEAIIGKIRQAHQRLGLTAFKAEVKAQGEGG